MMITLSCPPSCEKYWLWWKVFFHKGGSHPPSWSWGKHKYVEGMVWSLYKRMYSNMTKLECKHRCDPDMPNSLYKETQCKTLSYPKYMDMKSFQRALYSRSKRNYEFVGWRSMLPLPKVEVAKTNIPSRTNTLKTCTTNTYRSQKHSPRQHQVFVFVLRHLPIKLWTLVTFSHTIQVRHTLVHCDPFPIANKGHLNVHESSSK